VSFIQDAVAHILSEMRRNGVETTEEMRVKVRDILKEKMFDTERRTFREAMSFFHRPPEVYPPDYKRKIQVYQSGAFNLCAFAPGGICEVDEHGKPVPWETIRCPMCVEDDVKHDKDVCEAKYQARHGQHQCNGDYWYKSGCGKRVVIDGSYCPGCQQVLKDNEGKWPGPGRND
jgi:hypothetical protein